MVVELELHKSKTVETKLFFRKSTNLKQTLSFIRNNYGDILNYTKFPMANPRSFYDDNFGGLCGDNKERYSIYSYEDTVKAV